MSDSIVTSVEKIQGYLLHDAQKELLKIKDKLITFSESAKSGIIVSDFKGQQSEENLNRLIGNIYLKIEYAHKVLEGSISDLIGLQQQKDISFLYLWSTLNEIFELRIKIDDHAISFLNRDKMRWSITLKSAESELNNYRGFDIQQKLFIVNLVNGIRGIIVDGRDIHKYVHKNFLDIVRIFLSSEYNDYLYKFDKCRSRRNKLLMIHRNILRFKRDQDVSLETIEDIKHLIGLLLYINVNDQRWRNTNMK